MVESGEVLGNQIKSHSMQLMSYTNDEHILNFRLHLITGEADLYLKMCQKNIPCRLTEKETSEKQTAIFKKSIEKGGVKTITLPVICQNPVAPQAVPNFEISDLCLFGLFIVGNNKNGKGKVHYELSVEDLREGSHLMVRDHFLNLE